MKQSLQQFWKKLYPFAFGMAVVPAIADLALVGIEL